MNTLLLGDPDPSLRWRAAVELDGADDNDDDVRRWRAEVDASDHIAALVTRLAAAGDDPQAAGYLLCQLVYLGYRGPALAEAVEGIFAHQQTDGSWPVGSIRAAPRPRRRRGQAPPSLPPAESYRMITTKTTVPLRGIAAAGFATDPRAERAYEWLVAERLRDGSWTGSHKRTSAGTGTPPVKTRPTASCPRGRGAGRRRPVPSPASPCTPNADIPMSPGPA